MGIRPFRVEDTDAVQAIIAANGKALAVNGETHYGKIIPQDWLTTGVNRVLEREGRLVGFCRFLCDTPMPDTAWVPCFVIDPGLHGTPVYIRLQVAMEREIASHGQRSLIATVGPGHTTYRAYLVKRGYHAYDERDGTTFYVKQLLTERRESPCAAAT